MIVGNLIGGLGNQMFQYACARALALHLNLPLKFNIDHFDSHNTHNGFELERVFGLKLDTADSKELRNILGWGRNEPIIRRILSKPLLSWFAGQHFLSEPHFRYWSKLYDRARKGGYLHGYWQSELYFADHADQIRADFTFNKELHGHNLQIAQLISKRTAISIHVRRGDYVSNRDAHSLHGTCPPEYYHSAIQALLEKCPDAHLFAFSDDPGWVCQILQPRYPNLTIVKHNKGVESHNDMRLMSMCNHHVIANSSFSWWGAWLNPRPDKMIIAPARWFANGIDTHDLIPDSWERI